MATKKKLFGAAAGAAAGGGALNVEDVFSTYLYYPTGNTHTVTNGIDLSGEGGLVWLKNRLTVSNHELADTERGVTKKLSSNSTAAEDSLGDLSAFNSDGFSLTANNGNAVYNTAEVASWTFRKAPKFFDVVTYTGNGTAGRTVSHNLGTTVGTIIVKRTDSTSDWRVFHRSLGATAVLRLNSTAEEGFSSAYWNDTAPTSTEFTVGSNNDVNGNGMTYVAYLFAHNDGDGDFGPTGDQDIIKCGSYAGNGSTDGPEINLGFEPQFIMVKKHIGGTGNWFVFDTMRGLIVGGADIPLRWNDTPAETNVYGDIFSITPTGFKLVTTSGTFNDGADEYIYIAIRRGPMAVPESAADVFDIDTEGSSEPYYNSGFPVDFGLQKRHNAAGDWFAMSRLTQGKTLKTNLTNAEVAESSAYFDYMNGFVSAAAYGSGNSYGWMWRRAPQFFDVVCWKSETGSSNRRVTHNLGVAPEMVIVRRRDSDSHWYVYHKDVGTNNYLRLNTSAAQGGFTNCFNTATDTDWGYNEPGFFNYADLPMLGYFFASLDGVSKVGSYTGDGTTDGSNVIDCGFSAGARFVLVKRTDAAADWALFDSERGIISGNDPRLFLSATNAQTTSTDFLVPNSSGFAFKAGYNESGASYIFYAVSA